MLDDMKNLAISITKQEYQQEIYSRYPIYKQLSAALNLYEDEYLTSMKVFISDKIEACNRLEDEIMLCDSEVS